jgi:hypothetical protein
LLLLQFRYNGAFIKEYAELEWPIDTRDCIDLGFWYQYDRDDFKRRERHLYMQYGFIWPISLL